MKNAARAFVVTVIGMLALAAAAQELTEAPAFEVAAIAEVSPSGELSADIRSGAVRPGMLVTETRLSITYLSLRDIVRRAYEVEHYQMSIPEWTGQTRFNIHATIPAGPTREQVPAMLRRLLAERFGLVVRLEPRPFPVYALVVGSGGALLRETEADASAADRPAGPDGATTNSFVLTLASERSDAIMKFSMGSGGTMRVDFIRMPMAELASNLSDFVDRPVVDRTGLTGLYDFTLEFSSPPTVSGPGAGFGAPSAAGGREPAGIASTLFGQNEVVRALEKIGLALEPRREPLQMVIVEELERVPAPN